MKRYQIVPESMRWLGTSSALRLLITAFCVLLSLQARAQAVPAPQISDFSPSSGPVGTKVTITGQNLGGTSSVTFNGIAAQSITVFDTSQVVATVPVGATNGPITVVTAGGSAVTTTAFTVTATQPPVVSDFTPSGGPVGTKVTIEGDNLAGATEVNFDGIVATFQVGFGGTNLVATVPASATTGPITVVTPAGADTTKNSFVVTATPPPALTDFSPQTGPADTQVVLNGTNLDGATSVKFNGVTATIVWDFPNTITAIVPDGAGTGPIEVVTPGGTATASANFVFSAAAAPIITSVSPSSGKAGDHVTIAGANLDTATAVSFNGVPATFSVFGSIFATVPANASTGPITVVNPSGTGTSPTPFTIVNPLAPQITSFSPDSGGPGVSVSVTGVNLNNVTDVLIGGASATFTATSSTQLNATVPAGATTGAIVVDTAAGTATSTNLFFMPASITSFTPASGPVGTSVVIQGLNFTGAFAVLFGGVTANFTPVSPTQIQATVPEGAPAGAISIATPAGFAISTTAFLLPPSITAFFPVSGPVGTDVSITGANLLSATSVRLGSTELTFTVTSPNSIATKVPAGATGGGFTVTTPAGSVSTTDSFYVGSFDDLTLAVTPSAGTVSVNDFLSYTIEVKNLGPLDAPNVLLTDRLPEGVTLISSPSNCFTTNNVTTCNLGTLAAGADLIIRLAAVVNGPVYLTNRVDLTTTGADPNLSNNSNISVTALNGVTPPPADVTLSAAHDSSLVNLSWPTAAGFVLEATSDLTPPVHWTAVTDAAVESNGLTTVTQNPIATVRFYRLHKP